MSGKQACASDHPLWVLPKAWLRSRLFGWLLYTMLV